MGLHRAVVITLVYVRQNLNQAAVGDLFGISQPTVSRIGRLVLVDGTDVPTGNRAGHKGNYSGKRHCCGLNLQVASDIDGGPLGTSVPLPGAMHDRTAFAECGWEDVPRDTPTIADPAYQGMSAITPRKKPRGGELSEGDKANNKTTSSLRSAVERCIAHVKNWKMIATGYRGHLSELPTIIRIITALEFYRLGW
ncbi:MAG TPA: transposase family protein [Micromonosporaceae bacterium]